MCERGGNFYSRFSELPLHMPIYRVGVTAIEFFTALQIARLNSSNLSIYINSGSKLCPTVDQYCSNN